MFASECNRSQHVVNIMFSQERTMHRLANIVAYESEARAFRTECLDIFCSHICSGFQSKQDDFALEVTAELAHIIIVSIQYRGAAMGKAFDQFVFGARDPGQRIETLKMYRRYICDYALI